MAAVCCQCNGRKAKCSRCVCASAGCLCTSCRAPCYSNRSTLPPQSSTVNQSPSSSSQASATCSVPAASSLPSGPPLPSLASVSSTRVFSLPHVPKGVRRLGWHLLAGVKNHLLFTIGLLQVVSPSHVTKVYPP